MAIGTPYVCGSATASGSDTLVIPISVDVPRTDPVLGASFVFVYVELDNEAALTPISLTDDAPVADAYSLCLFADGLNHYDPNSGPMAGLIVNPLVAGVNSITLVNSTPNFTFARAVAIAVTGIGGLWPFNPLDPTMTWWPGALLNDPGAEAPVGAPTTISTGPSWNYAFPTNAVVMISPTGAVTDQNWDWANGEVALYATAQTTKASDPGAWTWADGSLVSLANTRDATGLPGSEAWIWMDVAYGLVVPTIAGPSFVGALADASSLFGGGGNGFALIGGAGPVCAVPPPGGGIPIFNNHIRLSE